MSTFEEFVMKGLIGFCGVLTLVLLYLLFVMVPVALYADAECLRAGYPKAHVTIGLERYCSTLDGSVTVKIEKKS